MSLADNLFSRLARALPQTLADKQPLFRAPVVLPKDFDAVNAELEEQAPYRRQLEHHLKEDVTQFDPNNSRG